MMNGRAYGLSLTDDPKSLVNRFKSTFRVATEFPLLPIRHIELNFAWSTLYPSDRTSICFISAHAWSGFLAI